MLTFLDLLVILFMGLAFVSLLSLALMFLIKRKVVQYVTMGVACAAAAIAAFFGLMVGVTGYFTFQIAVSLVAMGLIAASVALAIIGVKQPKQFLYAKISTVAALVLSMLSAFFI